MKLVSIPLEQGGVFRQMNEININIPYSFQSLWSRAGSFDLITKPNLAREMSLNPFRAGQGLSTIMTIDEFNAEGVSIPLEQGRVFRPILDIDFLSSVGFQSL